MVSTKGGIVLQSDFVDYYDHLCRTENGLVIYNRSYSNSESRATQLARLKLFGIQTVTLKSVSSYDNYSGFDKLVVYLNQKEHMFRGKEILSIQDAKTLYPNCAAIPFFDESDGITLKVLQVGKRRFRVMFKNDNINILQEGNVTDITEIQSDIDYRVGLPVYSIDYLQTRYGVLAIDFNYVQKLSNIGIQAVLTDTEAYEEIKDALIKLTLDKKGE